MSSAGLIKLLELRNSNDKYIEMCQGYADSPFDKERWMLHYDVLTALVDDERIDEESGDATFENQRFMMLEGLSKEVALVYQNFYLKQRGLPTLINATADAIDKVHGDLIELKVTWIPESGRTTYLEKSIEKAKETGMILIVADTNSCDIYPKDQKVFSKGLDMVRGMLIRRKEVMEEYNMSDNSILQKIVIKPLPKFLKKMSLNLNLKDSEFFDINKAKYKKKPRNEWYAEMTRKETQVKKLRANLLKGRKVLEPGGPSRKRTADPQWDTIISSAVKRAKLLKSDKEKETLTKAALEMQEAKNQLTLMENQQEDARLCFENSAFPCANRTASLVTRNMNIKEGSFLEEMNKKTLIKKLKEIDSGLEEADLYMKWRGLVLPLNQTVHFIDLELEEFAIFCDFTEPIHRSKDGAENWLGLKGLLEEIKVRPKDILGLSAKNLSKVASEGGKGKDILDLFGVGWKEYKQVGLIEPEGLVFEFEEKRDAPDVGFPYWFEKIRENMMNLFDGEHLVMPTLTRRECISNHPVDGWAERIVNAYMNYIVKTNSLFYCSFVENIYNRLGGMLSAGEGTHVREKAEGKRQYNNLRIQANMLETVCYKYEGVELIRKKMAIGVVFRGPTHARQPTDTTNLFVLTFIKPELMEDEDQMRILMKMHPNYSFGFGTVRNERIAYGIRRYAIRRIDPSYFSFITNTLFEPMNSMGHYVFESMADDGFYGINTDEYVDDNAKNVLMKNFGENVIVGINMTNFDEGLMPFCRYEFLNSQARKAHEENFNLDYNSYLEKLISEYKRAGIAKWLLKNAIF